MRDSCVFKSQRVTIVFTINICIFLVFIIYFKQIFGEKNVKRTNIEIFVNETGGYWDIFTLKRYTLWLYEYNVAVVHRHLQYSPLNFIFSFISAFV